jgi:hypothetical protein
MKKYTIIPGTLSNFTDPSVKKFLMGIAFLALLCGCQSGESCHKVLKAKCIECHSTETSCAKIGQSEDWWLRTIDAMVKLGADVSKQERKVLAECLSTSPETNLEKICQ